MQFGLAVPTGTEGMMYPVPYADPAQAVDLAVFAEQLGFDSVWGNDHISTQAYVRAEFEKPPRFYDPYLYLSFVAARTRTIRLATAITVMTFRHPVVVAKQAMTLDQLSGGRFSLGLGIGAYREETEAMWPGRRMHRGHYADEFMRSLGLLLTERRATFTGDYISFTDVESYPKAVQDPLPVLSGGNAGGSKERAGKYAHGWLPACLTPAEMAAGVADVRRSAEAVGRTLPADFDVAPQMSVAIASTEQGAADTFQSSQLYNHMRSLSESTLKGRQADWAERNLIGTPERVIDQVGRYAEAGVTTLSGLLFASNDVSHTRDQMQQFAETVIAVVNGKPAAPERAQVRAPEDLRD
jgi:probable F420-dependent oxidoreductase